MSNETIKYNMNIPGWNREPILTYLHQLSSEVPESGVIIELGALFGRTTFSLGKGKHHDTKLIVVDIWSSLLFEHHTENWFHDNYIGEVEQQLLNRLVKDNPKRIDYDDFYLLWKVFTRGIPNMSSFRDMTSMDHSHIPDADLIVHDAAHDGKTVYKDLCHWFPKLKLGGKMVIDDYERVHFYDLMQAVDRFCAENNIRTEMAGDRNIVLFKDDL